MVSQTQDRPALWMGQQAALHVLTDITRVEFSACRTNAHVQEVSPLLVHCAVLIKHTSVPHAALASPRVVICALRTSAPAPMATKQQVQPAHPIMRASAHRVTQDSIWLQLHVQLMNAPVLMGKRQLGLPA